MFIHLCYILITLAAPIQWTMLLNAVRVGTEVAGALAAGVVAAELIAPSLHGNDFNECLEKKSACFISQSGSLSSEFIDIFRELQESSRFRILDICTTNDGNARKAIAPADIDEFLSGLTNDDPDMNACPDFYAENVMLNDGNNHGMKRPQVIERYRLIPLAEVAKLSNIFGGEASSSTNSTQASSPQSSSSSSSAWFRPLTGSSSPSYRGGGRARPVAEVLAVMWERDRCAADLVDNFELQVL